LQLVGDFINAKRRKALQPQIENGPRLFIRKPVIVVSPQRMPGIGNERDQRSKILCGPSPAHQGFARFAGILGSADQLDHVIDVGNRDGQAHQDMRTVPRLVQQELGTPRHHVFAE